MRDLTWRAAGVAGAAVVLLVPAAGVASAAGGAVTATRLAAATRAVASGTWGKAEEVPGAVLRQGGGATILSVSCAAAGACSAGGSFADGSGDIEAFVVSEVNGTWRKALEVPGIATLNQGGEADIYSVSCAGAGTCSAGGIYADGFGGRQAFVVNQVNGIWGKAREVPGTAALNQGGGAAVDQVSCAGAGMCSAGGAYTDSSGNEQAFVVSEVNGTWGKAREVPGTAALNTGLAAGTLSVSCAKPGTCSAGGFYTDSVGFGNQQAFVVNEVNGHWGKAREVPGTAALNQGGFAEIFSVSCAAAGACSAGGNYSDSPGSGHVQAFVVSEVNGTWRKAREVPGTGALNLGGDALTISVSCAAAGNCSAGGRYTDSSGHGQAFVVKQVNGIWGKAREVPGTAALNQGGGAAVSQVSCAQAGACSAAGQYVDSSGHQQAFVVNQVNGIWGKARKVPGTTALNQGGFAAANSVSCAPAGTCSAGGTYADNSGHHPAFVVNRS